MSDCWLIASAALGSAVIGSLSRSRSLWPMDWTLRVVFACRKSCRFNLHTLKVAFGRGKAIPHSLYVMYLCGTGGRSAWLAAGGPNLSAVDRQAHNSLFT